MRLFGRAHKLAPQERSVALLYAEATLRAGDAKRAAALLEHFAVPLGQAGHRLGQRGQVAFDGPFNHLRRYVSDRRRLVLETGVHQEAAIALYRRAGFAEIDCWGEYASSPTSICFEKNL